MSRGEIRQTVVGTAARAGQCTREHDSDMIGLFRSMGRPHDTKDAIEEDWVVPC